MAGCYNWQNFISTDQLHKGKAKGESERIIGSMLDFLEAFQNFEKISAEPTRVLILFQTLNYKVVLPNLSMQFQWLHEISLADERPSLPPNDLIGSGLMGTTDLAKPNTL